jgi:MFS family permease
MKLSGTLLRSALVAGLGGLLCGFDTAVISGTTGWLKRQFDLNHFTLGFTVASALIGTIIGSLAVGTRVRREPWIR